MRIVTTSFLAMMLLLAEPSASACSWGTPDRRLQDEIHSYYDADTVFLARLKEPRSLSADGAHQFAMLVSDYDLIESYRGNPPQHGTVATEDRTKPGRDGTPPNSCTGWLLHPGIGGKKAVIFARKSNDTYLIDAQSNQVDDSQSGSQDLLQRLRLYRKFEESP